MKQNKNNPGIGRSVRLDFGGDWGQANFHRIASWLTQEVCDRAGPRSRTRIHSFLGGGLESLWEVYDGELDMCIATPHRLTSFMLTGEGLFSEREPLDTMRGLAVMPQNDRMVFAISPKFGINSFEELRKKKPALRIASSKNDDGNFIGYVADHFMEAHGVGEEKIKSWGGEYLREHRPEQCLQMMEDGLVDAVIQEAIMTPWWRELIEGKVVIPLSGEAEPLARLEKKLRLPVRTIPAGYWEGQTQDLLALDFSDFLISVREDMPEDIAYLLTWCLVETRATIEKQYKHIPPDRSPISYPLDPVAMSQTAIPLHPGAQRYFEEAGYIKTSAD